MIVRSFRLYSKSFIKHLEDKQMDSSPDQCDSSSRKWISSAGSSRSSKALFKCDLTISWFIVISWSWFGKDLYFDWYN